MLEICHAFCLCKLIRGRNKWQWNTKAHNYTSDKCSTVGICNFKVDFLENSKGTGFNRLRRWLIHENVWKVSSRLRTLSHYLLIIPRRHWLRALILWFSGVLSLGWKRLFEVAENSSLSKLSEDLHRLNYKFQNLPGINAFRESADEINSVRSFWWQASDGEIGSDSATQISPKIESWFYDQSVLNFDTAFSGNKIVESMNLTVSEVLLFQKW